MMSNKKKMGNEGDGSTVYNREQEDTVLDNAGGTAGREAAGTGNAALQVKNRNGGMWKKVTVGTTSAVALGAAAAFMMHAVPAGAETTADTPDDGGPHPMDEGSDILMAAGVNDDMSFSQAFAEARHEVGPGGVFTWHGNVYGTYLADEWDSMSEEEHEEWGRHFGWSSHTGSTSQGTGDTAGTPSRTDTPDPVVPAGSHPEAGGGDGPAAVTDSDPSDEVEVLGVVHDPGTGANYGEVMAGGQDIVLVDVDGDQVFESAWIDDNHNGEMEAGEIHETSEVFGQEMDVAGLDGFSDPVGNPLMSENEMDYTNDANLYDA